MKSKSIVIFLTVTLLLLLASGSCNRKSQTSGGDLSRFQKLYLEAVAALHAGDFNRGDSISAILENEAKNSGNDLFTAYALVCQGWYSNDPREARERLKKLKEAEVLALRVRNDSLLSCLYNIMGIHALSSEGGFGEAKQCFTEAIRYGNLAGARDYAVSAECNLSAIYHSLGDTLGIAYDKDIYDFALKSRNIGLLLNAARNCAEYYIDTGKSPELALPYMDKVLECDNKCLYRVLRAKYFMATDSLNKALDEFNIPLPEGETRRYYNLTRGELLNRLGRWKESDYYLDCCVSLQADPEDVLSDNETMELLRLRGDNFRHLGRSAEALEYYDRYITLRDSVAELRNTEEVNSFKVKYDTEKKELALTAQKALAHKQLAISIGVVAVCLIVIAFLIISSRKRRDMQRLIVRKQKDFSIRRQEIIDLMKPDNEIGVSTPAEPDSKTGFSPEVPEGNVTPSEAKSESQLPAGLSEFRVSQIWKSILNFMENDRVFTDPSISRDTFAEKVGCNHTWFSSVIKLKTGKSYSQFMNTWRINEAVDILSKPDCNISGKQLAADLGFLTAPTFYAAFRRQMGMSPGDFRKRIEEDLLAAEETADAEE